MSTSIQELFNISDQLAKNLEIPHKLAVPKMTKIVLNAGIGSIKEDNKAIEKMKKRFISDYWTGSCSSSIKKGYSIIQNKKRNASWIICYS
jgi:ribosomal protein L5